MQLTNLLLTVASALAIDIKISESSNGVWDERVQVNYLTDENVCYSLPKVSWDITVPEGYHTLFWKNDNCNDSADSINMNPYTDLLKLNGDSKITTFKIIHKDNTKTRSHKRYRLKAAHHADRYEDYRNNPCYQRYDSFVSTGNEEDWEYIC